MYRLRRFVAFLHMASTCLLNESLSKITPRYLSVVIFSMGVKFLSGMWMRRTSLWLNFENQMLFLGQV